MRLTAVKHWLVGPIFGVLMATTLIAACDNVSPVGSIPGESDHLGSGAWTHIAESPLSPRDRVSSSWTGDELLVIGGSTQGPCPPAADCIGPTRTELRSDGAAYDPEANTWTRLPDAPIPVVSAIATWTGDKLVLLVPALGEDESNVLLSFDPKTNRWDELPSPPSEPYLFGGEWTGDSIVYWQSQEEPERKDWVFDLPTKSWHALPADPFTSTFDRTYTWVGDRLIFTALLTSGINNDESHRDVYQVAEVALDDLGDTDKARWHELAPSEVGFWNPSWFWHESALVNPSQQVSTWQKPRANRAPPGGQYDPESQTWSPIPEFPGSSEVVRAGCPLPAVGTAGGWLVGGGPLLVSLNPDTVEVAPPCPELAEPAVGAWTGDEIIIWGGPDAKYQQNQNVGLSWQP